MEEKRITVTEEQKIQLEECYREALLALESIGRILEKLKVIDKVYRRFYSYPIYTYTENRKSHEHFSGRYICTELS